MFHQIVLYLTLPRKGLESGCLDLNNVRNLNLFLNHCDLQDSSIDRDLGPKHYIYSRNCTADLWTMKQTPNLAIVFFFASVLNSWCNWGSALILACLTFRSKLWASFFRVGGTWSQWAYLPYQKKERIWDHHKDVGLFDVLMKCNCLFQNHATKLSPVPVAYSHALNEVRYFE